MYGVSLMIMIFTTMATALSGSGPGTSAVGIIVFWRVLLGIGIGGDYPMSAVITSEFASTRYRGRMMAAVFSMQGFGIITAALVYYFTLLAFQSAIVYESVAIPIPSSLDAPNAGLPAIDRVWRIVVGFGCIPALISLYYRLTIPETPRYTIDIERNIAQGTTDVENFLANDMPHGKDDSVPQEHQNITPKASRRDFIRHFGQWKYGKVLLGTAGSWFMLDIAFYGLGLNNSIILQAIGYASNGTTYEILHNIAVGNLIIQCAGTLPGYWFAVGFIDVIGRKPMQIGSFAILTGLFVIIGFAYWPLYAQESKAGFIALFVMCQFFMNFGANTTTVFTSLFSANSSSLSLAKSSPLVTDPPPMVSRLHAENSVQSSPKSSSRLSKIKAESPTAGSTI
jgi:MFS transporter, PHS family, inorganic phosphate transporter